MMKGFIIQQQNQQLMVEENMSNLTSASGEASVSSNQQQSSFASPNPNPNPTKKKRNLPGNPDPDAEVMALSPKTLMATNRFLCEICNKGFQRDQNLQLHRRGHNLPWKLKQRNNKEVRKKVYICPEVSCVHHDPSRALGDLTGIKKHFSRKHGEKKWKCEKCSKKYAVQSDWKAHSKICGTREYRCDCGTLFSRRDSFITHRAFCDALAEESARAANPLAINNHHHHPLLFSQPSTTSSNLEQSLPFTTSQFPHPLIHQELTLKRENQFNMRPDIPPWLACPSQGPTSLNHLDLLQDYSTSSHDQAQAQALPSAHMSATALLQKAAQMGATMSRPAAGQMAPAHAISNATAAAASVFGLGLSSNNQEMDNNNNNNNTMMHQDMMMAAAAGFDHGGFGEAFGGMLGGSKREDQMKEGGGANNNINNNNNSNNINDGMTTRDFLGLRALSHREILNMAGLDHCMSSSSYDQTQQSKKPWN